MVKNTKLRRTNRRFLIRIIVVRKINCLQQMAMPDHGGELRAAEHKMWHVRCLARQWVACSVPSKKNHDYRSQKTVS